MADLPVITLHRSRGMPGDCSITALAIICGKEPEEVIATASEVDSRAGLYGLYLKDIIAIAARLSVTLRRRRKYDLDTACGILSCFIIDPDPARIKRGRQEHVAVLKNGMIFDNDQRVWDVDAFQQHYKAKWGLLLELV